MDYYKHKTSPIREKRLNAISAYFGDVETILQEFRNNSVNQRIRTFSQDSFSDIQYALQLIHTMKDIAIVVHGPAGCSTAHNYFDFSYDDTVKWVVTNLNERDSIMGSDVKLRDAIRQVFKSFNPKIIFVVTTPVVAINNDDVEAVVDELHEEYNIPIVPVYSDGFRSKTGVTGYDVALHAMLKNLVPKTAKISVKGNFINLLSVSENLNDLKELVHLLEEIGLSVNILPRYSGIENFSKANDAIISVSVNYDESNYLGKALEEKYEHKYLQTEIPIGIKKTSAWLGRIGEELNLSVETTKIIEKETYHLEKFLENRKFEGKKIFINLSPSHAFGIIEFLEELGFEIVALKVPYLDTTHYSSLERIAAQKLKYPIFVGEGQIFEETNIVNETKPDLYISEQSDNISAIRAGIPVLDIGNLPVLGFKGVYNIVEKLERKLANTSFTNYLSGNRPDFYSKNWKQKKPNWYIKQEVK